MPYKLLRKQATEALSDWTRSRFDELREDAALYLPDRYLESSEADGALDYVVDQVNRIADGLAEAISTELSLLVKTSLSDQEAYEAILALDKQAISDAVLDSSSYSTTPPRVADAPSSRKALAKGAAVGTAPLVLTAILVPEPLSKASLLVMAGSGVVGAAAGYATYRRFKRDTGASAAEKLRKDIYDYIDSEERAVHQWLTNQVIDEYIARVSAFCEKQQVKLVVANE